MAQPHQSASNPGDDRAAPHVSVANPLQTVEHQRHPREGVNDVEVRDVADHECVEAADEAAECCREVRSGQTSNEQECRGARDGVRGDQKDIPVDAKPPAGLQHGIPDERLRIGGNRKPGEHAVGPDRH